ncbi:unnamed protein product [Caretta caretta]
MVEKCTRLHIHYAHRLCEEPMSCFDAKISFENMTKCLQILKERYQDLDNQDIYCNNEVEFRDYSVLLSLSKGYSQVISTCDYKFWTWTVSCQTSSMKICGGKEETKATTLQPASGCTLRSQSQD